MKAYAGVDVYIHMFLASALAEGELSASRPCCFTTGERAPGTHGMGGWVDPRTDLDDMESENSYSHRDSNCDPSVVQAVASRYNDWVIPALLTHTHTHISDLISYEQKAWIWPIRRMYWLVSQPSWSLVRTGNAARIHTRQALLRQHVFHVVVEIRGQVYGVIILVY
jgi:hypothetical protein